MYITKHLINTVCVCQCCVCVCVCVCVRMIRLENVQKTIGLGLLLCTPILGGNGAACITVLFGVWLQSSKEQLSILERQHGPFQM